MLAALQKGASDPTTGARVLVRGSYVHTPNVQAPNGDRVTFAPTEVWLAQIDEGSTDGAFVRVGFNGRRCAVAPCPSTTEGRLNSVRTADVHNVYFDPTTPAAVTAEAKEAILGTEGALVVGFRAYGGTAERRTTLRTVNQVFLCLQ